MVGGLSFSERGTPVLWKWELLFSRPCSLRLPQRNPNISGRVQFAGSSVAHPDLGGGGCRPRVSIRIAEKTKTEGARSDFRP
jgi:hypothetical protein